MKGPVRRSQIYDGRSKMVELSITMIFLTLIPVATNLRKARRALQRLLMRENRYERGARNIAGFNAKVAEYTPSQR